MARSGQPVSKEQVLLKACPYPLLLEPPAVERPWGGTRLGAEFGKTVTGGAGRIGESWESGFDAQVLNGPLAGQSLGDLARRLGAALIGQRANSTPEVPFPLLAKLIDARETLSIQVHPGDAWARAHLGQPQGKTEAWHIIAAEQGATIYHGPLAGTDRAAISGALGQRELIPLLDQVPVAAGDTLFTPAGTLHAIGAGILLYEIQQYSDTTFRLYDWERRDDRGQPREIHLEQGAATLDAIVPTHHINPPLPLDDRGDRHLLVACRHFALELLNGADGEKGEGTTTASLPGGTSFHLLTVLAGTATLAWAGDRADEAFVEAGRGRTVLVPAALDRYHLTLPPGCRILRAFVPDLTADVVAPLRTRGVDDALIAELGGGFPSRNDLLPLLRGESRP